MRQNVSETLVVTRLELLHHASTHDDLEAWAAFRQSLEETVLTWLHKHQGTEAACHLRSEQYFVAQAFERLRQATVQGQVTCESLSEVLVYLRACLNGAILEVLRDSKRPEVVSSLWPDGGDLTVRNELWEWLQARLPNRREQRLAYLLFHCGMEPVEIMRSCPLEWGNVREVIRLRRIILARFIQSPSCQVP
jgi:hypothetical protein